MNDQQCTQFHTTIFFKFNLYLFLPAGSLIVFAYFLFQNYVNIRTVHLCGHKLTYKGTKRKHRN